MVDMPVLLTVEEVAHRLRLSRQTVRRQVARGDLRAVRVGHRPGSPIRIEARSVDELLRPVEGRLGENGSLRVTEAALREFLRPASPETRQQP
jgi:excisionase family DNA binding protein